MSEGLSRTFEVLGQTRNDAAVRVLVPALDSSRDAIQGGALRTLLRRRSLVGGGEILSRLPTMNDRCKRILRRSHGRLTGSLRDALLGTDRQLCLNACQATVLFREYDLVPVLLNLLEDRTLQHDDLAADALMNLAEQLYKELAGPRDYNDRRDPQMIRVQVVASLELSVKRFANHRRREVIEAFLMLTVRDSATLKQILRNPHHPCFLATVDVLTKSERGGVVRLLLSFLEDTHVPTAALSVIANRCDQKFVGYLLRKIGREPSNVVRQNLRRIGAIGWLKNDRQSYLDQLDDTAQHGVVQLVMAAGIPRLEAFSIVGYLLRHGRPGGRRAAAVALAEFNGADANALAIQALGDSDPQVQASIVAHLRRRGIPGILQRLVDLTDSPHAIVRQAAQEALAEFTFARFLGAFEMLDEDVRSSTGQLVKRIDPNALALLKQELASSMRTRRLRGLAVAQAMKAVDDVEDAVVELLADSDHLVRVEAVAALAHGSTASSRRALQQALGDRNGVVREAARKALLARQQFDAWQHHLANAEGPM